MRTLFVGFCVLLAAVWQVTVVPLFPVANVTADVVVLVLVLIAAFGKPQRAMFAIPLAAVLYGLIADRAPGLLLLGYLPLLPLLVYLEEARVPLNHFARTVLSMVAVGAWMRTLFVLSAVVGGAETTVPFVMVHVLLPGALLDFALLGMAYLPFRLLGWSSQGMALRRGTYYSSL